MKPYEQSKLRKYDDRCWSINVDITDKAIKLAITFKEYCIEHNLPPTIEIAGVAWDAQSIKDKAYITGKNYEKERIVMLLGLN